MTARTGTAVAVSILMLGVAIAVSWLLLGPAIVGSSPAALNGPLAQPSPAAPAPAGLAGQEIATGAFQLAQPRDPFRPLITEGSPVGDGGGAGTYEPSGTRVHLVEIREVSGVLRATVQVDSTSYDVGVGDVFADDYMVVSLDADSGVFLYRDNAFTLTVGDVIFK